MTDKKRQIDKFEVAECAALKAALEDFNAGKPRKDSLTQGKIAEALDITQGSVSSYLNGYMALNARVASTICGLIGIPVSHVSPRLAEEIEQLSKWAYKYPAITGGEPAGVSDKAAEDTGSNGYRTKTSAELRRIRSSSHAQINAVVPDDAVLKAVAAINFIQTALLAGRLPTAHFADIMRIREELSSAQRVDEGEYVPVPDNLKGLAKSAFDIADAGENPDDALKMHQLKMEKEFSSAEGVKNDGPRKKRSR